MVFQAAAVCLVTVLLALVVRRGGGELAMLLSLTAAVVVLLGLGKSMGELVAFLRMLGQRSGLPEALFVPLYKTVGISLVVKIGGDLCRDAGGAAPAAVLETTGAVCALLAALPMLETVLELLLEFMG